jgi:hypothetical protein
MGLPVRSGGRLGRPVARSRKYTLPERDPWITSVNPSCVRNGAEISIACRIGAGQRTIAGCPVQPAPPPQRHPLLRVRNSHTTCNLRSVIDARPNEGEVRWWLPRKASTPFSSLWLSLNAMSGRGAMSPNRSHRSVGTVCVLCRPWASVPIGPLHPRPAITTSASENPTVRKNVRVDRAGRTPSEVEVIRRPDHSMERLATPSRALTQVPARTSVKAFILRSAGRLT